MSPNPTKKFASASSPDTSTELSPSSSSSSPSDSPITPPVVKPVVKPIVYEISPYKDSEGEDEDEDSDDEEEDRKEKKLVPVWARPEVLQLALERQKKLDPDEIFLDIESPNLEEIFPNYDPTKKSGRKNRKSSGVWSQKDRATWEEKMKYRVEMGFLPKGYLPDLSKK